MKKILFSLIGLTFLAGLTGCEKDKPGDDALQERDVYYVVNEGQAASPFSGTTAHLNTDIEFDALLDRFCDYALDGSRVTFCSSHTGNMKSSASVPTSISTTDREELKKWMKEMEKAGKTVNITYDNGSGTWNGQAYANLGQWSVQEPQIYTGTLVFVPTPELETPPLGGVVWAMQVNADSTLILTFHGIMIWNDSVDDNMRILEGASMILEGVQGTYTDLNGNTFMTLALPVEEI